MSTDNGAWVKDPDAVLDYQHDWSGDGWLADGETITASEWIVPDGLTKQSDSKTGTSATVWLAGGTVDVDYAITNRISTSQGRTEDRTSTIMVRDR